MLSGYWFLKSWRVKKKTLLIVRHMEKTETNTSQRTVLEPSLCGSNGIESVRNRQEADTTSEGLRSLLGKDITCQGFLLSTLEILENFYSWRTYKCHPVGWLSSFAFLG